MTRNGRRAGVNHQEFKRERWSNVSAREKSQERKNLPSVYVGVCACVCARDYMCVCLRTRGRVYVPSCSPG